MFCVRGFGGGVGVSLFFWGVVLAFRRVFSGFWGLLCFSFVLLLLAWGGGRVAGGSGVRGSVRPGGLLPFRGGGLGGAPACARFLSCPVLAVVGVGGRVRGVRVARLPAVLWWGSGCARFPVRVRGVVVVFAGGFRVLFFPSGASRVFWFCGAWSFVGLWFPRGWGVVGGVGLGWGCFFSGFCCTGPGLFGFGLGFVWRV